MILHRESPARLRPCGAFFVWAENQRERDELRPRSLLRPTGLAGAFLAEAFGLSACLSAAPFRPDAELVAGAALRSGARTGAFLVAGALAVAPCRRTGASTIGFAGGGGASTGAGFSATMGSKIPPSCLTRRPRSVST